MTPTPARLKLLSTINLEIDECVTNGITGELVIRIPFSQGGIGQVKAEMKKILNSHKKPLDKLEIFSLSGK